MIFGYIFGTPLKFLQFRTMVLAFLKINLQNTFLYIFEEKNVQYLLNFLKLTLEAADCPTLPSGGIRGLNSAGHRHGTK